MFQPAEREATVERFIGALTMALGCGALIPRAGFGLYALLEMTGERTVWSMLMINVGFWLIATSYLSTMNPTRVIMLVVVIVFWAMIGWKFFDAKLWSAALQAVVVEMFAIDALVRTLVHGQKTNANPSSPI